MTLAREVLRRNLPGVQFEELPEADRLRISAVVALPQDHGFSLGPGLVNRFSESDLQERRGGIGTYLDVDIRGLCDMCVATFTFEASQVARKIPEITPRRGRS